MNVIVLGKYMEQNNGKNNNNEVTMISMYVSSTMTYLFLFVWVLRFAFYMLNYKTSITLINNEKYYYPFEEEKNTGILSEK
ncbi:hypothetical protein DERP_008840 [Dermatophagoides pteronyssinus]|uniref:Uncharacterized protein n=1 Tax=Dermatophagoides pteronyssinus TaxID=6956 RepID=A0ABQ8JNB4_DERPT|nr:hypothetical protein DERP_008840 [Dermatophagoides pteronyssinus]